MDETRDAVTLGSAVRSIRKERGWSLADASKATGFSISTLSKVENGQRSLTYDKLIQLAAKFSVDVSRLFTSGERKPDLTLFTGRRSVHRVGEGFEVPAHVYTYNYLAHDLIQKRFVPVLMEIHARSLDEFDQLVKHKGDEFAYVLEGVVEIQTEIYAPLMLKVGESVFFDSEVGHAYLNAGEGVAKILCIGSDVDDVVGKETLIPLAQEALAAAAGMEPKSKSPRIRKLTDARA